MSALGFKSKTQAATTRSTRSRLVPRLRCRPAHLRTPIGIAGSRQIYATHLAQWLRHRPSLLPHDLSRRSYCDRCRPSPPLRVRIALRCRLARLHSGYFEVADRYITALMLFSRPPAAFTHRLRCRLAVGAVLLISDIETDAPRPTTQTAHRLRRRLAVWARSPHVNVLLNRNDYTVATARFTHRLRCRHHVVP